MIIELKVKQGTSLGHIFWVYFIIIFFLFCLWSDIWWYVNYEQVWLEIRLGTAIFFEIHFTENFSFPTRCGSSITPPPQVTWSPARRCNRQGRRRHCEKEWMSRTRDTLYPLAKPDDKEVIFKGRFIFESSSKKRRSIFPSAPSYTTSPLSLVLMTISHTLLNRTNMGECWTMRGKVFR